MKLGAAGVALLLLWACGTTDDPGSSLAGESQDSPGAVVGQVLAEQPWAATSDGDEATFSPETFQDQYMVVASVADRMFGDRYVGGELDGRDIRLAVVDANDADADRLRRELGTDDRLAEAADQFALVPVEKNAAELQRARDEILQELPDGLRERISLSLHLAEGGITIRVVSEDDADAVREATGDLPDFVTIVVDPNSEITPANG